MAGVHAPDRPVPHASPPALPFVPLSLIEDGPGAGSSPDVSPVDPAELLLTCANCGARMDERKCKLICRCGYFLSCSDYY